MSEEIDRKIATSFEAMPLEQGGYYDSLSCDRLITQLQDQLIISQYSIATLKAQLAAKDAEIASLKREVTREMCNTEGELEELHQLQRFFQRTVGGAHLLLSRCEFGILGMDIDQRVALLLDVTRSLQRELAEARELLKDAADRLHRPQSWADSVSIVNRIDTFRAKEKA